MTDINERKRQEHPGVKPLEFDYSADAIVVGFGAAGANAAIAAHDAGAEVIVLEKLDTPGGNSSVCAGAMMIPQDLDEAIEYYRALSFGTVDEEMVRCFAKAMVEIPELLTKLGASVQHESVAATYFPALLTSKMRRIHFNPTGKAGFDFLRKQVDDRDIKVLLNTPALELIQDSPNRSVLGIRVERDGKTINLRARKGVILTCGGYGCNPALLADFHYPGATDYMFSWGTPGNTGDGIKLATEAGAALWHMASIEWGPFCAKEPSREFGTAVGVGVGMGRPEGGYIFINQKGKRFMAESTYLVHRKAPLEILSFDHDNAEYPNLPAYMICDQSYFGCGSLATTRQQFEAIMGGPVGYAMTRQIYEWSTDNSAEITKGWIKQSDTLADLAKEIGIDAIAFDQTAETFNSSSAKKQDPQFNRTENTLAPLISPPFTPLNWP